MMAMASSASASCFRYQNRLYGIANDADPGLYVHNVITSGDFSQTYCELKLTRDEYFAANPRDTFTYSCPANGWFAVSQKNLDYLEVTTPDSFPDDIHIDIDMEGSDPPASGIAYILSADGSNGC